MDLNRRAKRVGLTAIACAMLLRLYDAGMFRWAAEQLTAPDTAAFLLFLETGRRDTEAEGFDFSFLPESAAPAFAAQTLPENDPEIPSETVPQTNSSLHDTAGEEIAEECHP